MLQCPARYFVGNRVIFVIRYQSQVFSSVEGSAKLHREQTRFTKCSEKAAIKPLCVLAISGGTGAFDAIKAALAASKACRHLPVRGGLWSSNRARS